MKVAIDSYIVDLDYVCYVTTLNLRKHEDLLLNSSLYLLGSFQISMYDKPALLDINSVIPIDFDLSPSERRMFLRPGMPFYDKAIEAIKEAEQKLILEYNKFLHLWLSTGKQKIPHFNFSDMSNKAPENTLWIPVFGDKVVVTDYSMLPENVAEALKEFDYLTVEDVVPVQRGNGAERTLCYEVYVQETEHSLGINYKKYEEQ